MTTRRAYLIALGLLFILTLAMFGDLLFAGGTRVAGFQSAEISLLLPEKMSAEELFAEEATNTFEDATPGAAAVAAIDGPLGWLDEIGPAEISEECKFIVAGPIAEAFGHVAADRPSGTLAAALTSIGIPEIETAE